MMLVSAQQRKELVTNKEGDDLFTFHILHWAQAFPRNLFGGRRLTP